MQKKFHVFVMTVLRGIRDQPERVPADRFR